MIINFAAYSITDEAITLSEMESIFINLRSQGSAGKFIGGLLTQVVSMKGEEWVAKKWNQSGLQLNSLIDAEREDIDKIIKEHVRIFSFV
jgi:type VI protein secretion system component VasK